MDIEYLSDNDFIKVDIILKEEEKENWDPSTYIPIYQPESQKCQPLRLSKPKYQTSQKSRYKRSRYRKYGHWHVVEHG